MTALPCCIVQASRDVLLLQAEMSCNKVVQAAQAVQPSIAAADAAVSLAVNSCQPLQILKGSYLRLSMRTLWLLAGHFGVTQTLEGITTRLYWPDAERKVRDYVRDCSSCQLQTAHPSKPTGLLQPLDVPPSAWHTVTTCSTYIFAQSTASDLSVQGTAYTYLVSLSTKTDCYLDICECRLVLTYLADESIVSRCCLCRCSNNSHLSR